MLGQADPKLQARLLNDSRLFSTVPQPDADVTITSDSCTLPSNNALLINNGEECGRPQAHSNHLPENQDALLQSQLTWGQRPWIRVLLPLSLKSVSWVVCSQLI